MSGFADLYLVIYPTVVLARLQITLKEVGIVRGAWIGSCVGAPSPVTVGLGPF